MSGDRLPVPVVSVVLPAYNRVSLLEHAVRSVVAQTFDRWELIVVDDGSTDGTAEFLAGLDDARIQVLTREHSGNPAAARNIGIRQARGHYVAFMDSDDEWLPQKLDVQIAAMERNPDCRWSYTAVTHMDAEGRALPKERFKPWHPYSGEIFEQLLPHDAMIACPTVVVTRELLNEVGGFDETYRYAEDYELWLRLARMSSVLALPEVLARVRIDPNSNSYGKPGVNAAFIRIYESVLDASPNAKVRRICRRQAAFYWAYSADQLRGRREYQQAFGSLVRAFRLHPTSPLAWKVLAKAIVRDLLHIGRQVPQR